MFKWLKKLKLIVANYDRDVSVVRSELSELGTLIRDRTNIAVDIGFKDASHVIVIGRYQNADYVQTYSLGRNDLHKLVDQLRTMERHGVVARIDAPPQFRAVFERDGY